MIKDELQALVDKQAEDEVLWSVPFERLQPITEAYLQKELRKLHAAVEARASETEQPDRCIADDQWAIDAFYKGYDKANADFKANGFTGLKPIIGGIRSLVKACKLKRESVDEKQSPFETCATTIAAQAIWERLDPEDTIARGAGMPNRFYEAAELAIKALRVMGYRITRIEGEKP